MRRTAQSILLAVTAMSMACASTARAQEKASETRRGGHRSHGLRHALDRNRDGVISAEEIKGAAESLLKLDRNSDGNLTRDEMGPRRRRGAFPPDPSGVEKPPLAKNKGEKKILAVLDDLDRNQRPGMMNVPVEDGRLLRLLAETTGAKHVVEIGTSNGYSGIWFCLALRKTGGKLTTFEIDAERAELARQNFKRAGVDSMVTLIEGDAHKQVVKLKGPIDIVFLDADKQGYVDYLKKLLPKVRKGGLILAHNMSRMRGGVGEYIEAVTGNKDLETLFVHMQGAGVGVTLKKR